MNNPSILIKPGRDNKPYRLRARFKIEPHPSPTRLDREKVRVAEIFVEDMRKQGWVYDNRSGFRMSGPFPAITPITIRAPRTPSAREMLDGLSQGERFLDNGGTQARVMPLLPESEWWEFELAGIFIRTELMIEYPDLHEEDRG